MRKFAPFGQESRDLDIGIHAVLEFAVELQEIFVLEEHRRIALFDAENLRGRNLVSGGQRAARHTEQFAGVSFQVLALRDGPEELLAKRRVPNRVMEDRFFRAGKPGDHGLRRRLRNGMRRLSDRDLDRERVGLRRAIGISHFEEPEMRTPLARDRDFLRDAQLANRARLRAEPAAMPNVIRQDFALEPRALSVRQERLQIGRGVQRGHNAFLRSPRRAGLRPQDKPVMRVRAEGDRVGGLLDRREIVLAEHLHQAATGKAREIDLRRLGKTRKIDHDENGLVFEPAQKREDLGVFRIQETRASRARTP